MGTFSSVINGQLDAVYFIYGLAFLTMGGAGLLVRRKRDSAFTLSDTIWLLAGFGLTHGAHELLDLWADLKNLDTPLFDLPRYGFFLVSYLFLFEFGRRVMLLPAGARPRGGGKAARLLDWRLLPGLIVLILALSALAADPRNTAAILSRYLLCFPGALLAGAGLLRYYSRLKDKLEPIGLQKYFATAGFAFLGYGVFGGLLGPAGSFFPADRLNGASFSAAAGFPVELLRAACAVLISWGVIGILKIFNWESETELREANQNLLESEARFKTLAEKAVVGVYLIQDGLFTYVNPRLAEIFGYRPGELIGQKGAPALIFPEDWPVTGESKAAHYGFKGAKKDGQALYAEVYGSATESSGNPAVLGTLLDVTERKLAERQLADNEARLLRAHKMEAVGRLAGGIAHDFNNLLTGMGGYSDLLFKSLPPEDPRRLDVEAIKDGVTRAAVLTRQLLAFSRKQVLMPQLLDLNTIVRNTEAILRSYLGAGHELTSRLEPELKRVKADPSQMDQVLMALTLNSKEAMPCGGRIIIETRNVDLVEPAAGGPDAIPPGAYVQLLFSDTGCGMTPETLCNVCEPFFSTKEAYKGAGLGLPSVYGIVRQSEGYIAIDSGVGAGTTVTVYLPPAEGALSGPAARGTDSGNIGDPAAV